MNRLLCFVLVLSLLQVGCANADEARGVLLQVHAGEVRELVQGDRERHRRGIQRAASLLAPGFAITTATDRETQLRSALRYIQDPTHPADRVATELTTSPMTFLVAVDEGGTVIARDVTDPANDSFRGQDWSERFEVVEQTLATGTVRRGIGEFQSVTGPPSTSILFAAPVVHDGQPRGAVILGIPLRSWAQRVTNQLRLDHAETDNLQLWSYFFHGPHLAHIGTPELLDPLVPDGLVRDAGLGRSPGGFTGAIDVSGRPYAYLVMPLPTLGEGVGVVLLRSDPP